MTTAPIACAHCAAPLPADWVAMDSADCPNCQRWVRVIAFPALLAEEKKGSFGDRVLVEGESTCFYHAEKKAAVVCDGCGRFLCSLCDIEMNGEHLCSGCLESGRGRIGRQVDASRMLYEDLAFGLAAVGLFIGPIGVIPALAAIFVAIRYWRKPEKIGALGKSKKVAAIVLGVGVVALWGAVIFSVANQLIG